MVLAHPPTRVVRLPRDTAADALLAGIDAALTAGAATVAPAAARSRRPVVDIVEEWGLASFPASDPPSNW